MKLHILISFALAAILTAGCDRVRASLGMPTSDDIEAKRELIAETEAVKAKMAEQVKADSLATEAAREDTVAVAPEQQVAPMQHVAPVQHVAAEKQVAAAQQVDNQAVTATYNRYYVIIGVFRDKANAVKCKAKYEQNYAITSWKNDNGLIFLAIGGYEKSEEAEALLNRVKLDQPQAWIYKKKI